MKYLSSLVLLVLFATSLDASYARSIRVASFLSEESAQKGVMELRKFVNRDYRLSELQRKFNSDITIIRSGRYYISVIQPVTQRDAVQEILDIVRIRYPHAYPKKISLNAPRQAYVEPPRNRYREEPARIYGADVVKEVDKSIAQDPSTLPEDNIDVENIKLKSVPIDDDIVEDDIVEDEVPDDVPNKKLVLRTATREDVAEVPKKEEGFSLFGFNIGAMFDGISLDSLNIFSSSEKSSKSFVDSKIEQLNDYMLEIGVIFTFLVFLVFIKLYLVYQGRKEDKISMQDIYD